MTDYGSTPNLTSAAAAKAEIDVVVRDVATIGGITRDKVSDYWYGVIDRIYEGAVYPERYGTTDTMANTRAALQAALDTGKTVFLEDREYSFSGAGLTMATPGQGLVGLGPNSALKNVSISDGSAVLTVNQDRVKIANVEIQTSEVLDCVALETTTEAYHLDLNTVYLRGGRIGMISRGWWQQWTGVKIKSYIDIGLYAVSLSDSQVDVVIQNSTTTGVGQKLLLVASNGSSISLGLVNMYKTPSAIVNCKALDFPRLHAERAVVQTEDLTVLSIGDTLLKGTTVAGIPIADGAEGDVGCQGINISALYFSGDYANVTKPMVAVDDADAVTIVGGGSSEGGGAGESRFQIVTSTARTSRLAVNFANSLPFDIRVTGHQIYADAYTPALAGKQLCPTLVGRAMTSTAAATGVLETDWADFPVDATAAAIGDLVTNYPTATPGYLVRVTGEGVFILRGDPADITHWHYWQDTTPERDVWKITNAAGNSSDGVYFADLDLATDFDEQLVGRALSFSAWLWAPSTYFTKSDAGPNLILQERGGSNRQVVNTGNKFWEVDQWVQVGGGGRITTAGTTLRIFYYVQNGGTGSVGDRVWISQPRIYIGNAGDGLARARLDAAAQR